jgi:hypothetical protein
MQNFSKVSAARSDAAVLCVRLALSHASKGGLNPTSLVILNPKTLNPKPYTKPETLNHKPCTSKAGGSHACGTARGVGLFGVGVRRYKILKKNYL